MFSRKCLALFLISSVSWGAEYQLSIGSIFQNEGPYLKEWIEYHRKVGVDHFYLYNNESGDEYLTVLETYIQEGVVELIDWPTQHPEIHFADGAQLDMCNDVLRKSRGSTKWLAIIDIDEFMVPMSGTNIPAILNRLPPEAGAFYLNWRQFGTGGITCDPSAILRSLRKCASKEHLYCTYGKTITMPSATESIKSVHWCHLMEGFIYFNGDGEPYDSSKLFGSDNIHHDRLIRINHYTYRDEFYFLHHKLERCQKWYRGKVDDKDFLISLNQLFSEMTDEKINEILDHP